MPRQCWCIWAGRRCDSDVLPPETVLMLGSWPGRALGLNRCYVPIMSRWSSVPWDFSAMPRMPRKAPSQSQRSSMGAISRLESCRWWRFCSPLRLEWEILLKKHERDTESVSVRKLAENSTIQCNQSTNQSIDLTSALHYESPVNQSINQSIKTEHTWLKICYTRAKLQKLGLLPQGDYLPYRKPTRNDRHYFFLRQ